VGQWKKSVKAAAEFGEAVGQREKSVKAAAEFGEASVKL
jgi:hypothetical protein